MVVSTKKLQMFMTQVEFCGHILMAGKRAPAPGKLLGITKVGTTEGGYATARLLGTCELLFGIRAELRCPRRTTYLKVTAKQT